jgi:hypothetical protein
LVDCKQCSQDGKSADRCGACDEEDCHYACKMEKIPQLKDDIPYIESECVYKVAYQSFFDGMDRERNRMERIESEYNKIHDSDPMLQLVRMPRNQYEWALIPDSLRKKAPCPHPSQGVAFGEAMRRIDITKRYVCIMCHKDIPPENRSSIDTLQCPHCFYPGIRTCIGDCKQDE